MFVGDRYLQAGFSCYAGGRYFQAGFPVSGWFPVSLLFCSFLFLFFLLFFVECVKLFLTVLAFLLFSNFFSLHHCFSGHEYLEGLPDLRQNLHSSNTR